MIEERFMVGKKKNQANSVNTQSVNALLLLLL